MDTGFETFFATWTPRLTTALAEAIRHAAPQFEEPITAAGIATADSNLAFFLTAVTASEQEAIRTKYREKYPELVEDADNSWSPNEWSIQIEGADHRLWDLGKEYETVRSERLDSVDDDARESVWQDWEVQSLEALVTALGSREVRDAFAELNSNPVLVIMDTDGELNGPETFERLNSGRDDADFHAAKDYWESDL